jgi:hypothetical protein
MISGDCQEAAIPHPSFEKHTPLFILFNTTVQDGCQVILYVFFLSSPQKRNGKHNSN